MDPTFSDVMVDIETTGTRPDNAAIIQIAAVKFDLDTQAVDASSMFNRCLEIPPKRFWDEATREWWGRQKREVLQDIYFKMEDPELVLTDFAKWVGRNHQAPTRFWAKPSHFDFAFCESYFNQFGVISPFHYRNAIDMNSFIRGMTRSGDLRDFNVPFSGDAHNALFDVLHQIDCLFTAINATKAVAA